MLNAENKYEQNSMNRIVTILLVGQLFLIPSSAMAIGEQGLNSIISIIDEALDSYFAKMETAEGTDEEKKKSAEVDTNKVISLSLTLGKLSYSRLQCGQADILAEFTQRVQKMPEEFRNSMRDSFQSGFDKSKAETPLLSEDECERLTQSRNLADKEIEADVEEEKKDVKKEKVVEKPKLIEDPKLKHMRIAELSGQLAYKRKFCGDNKVVSRDFNEVIGRMPEEFQAEAKRSYWKGYKHGKRLNKSLNKESCL